ncbi:hypothetical protein ACFQFH_01515 [Halobaculum halobium]|uniref:Uncharacterized protein n=1 Tax=Halobaculum halobium TaxID=3032281 RepID=A0ABD5T636_9EURY|nr:hypothetical protein [Halobaculum sp. SYNS20]
MIGGVIELLRPFAWVVLPLMFFGSFAVVGVALVFHRRNRVRKTFVAGFLVTLLLFQVSVIPLTAPPFVTWHKFSSPWESERVVHQIRVVDDQGRELPYDDKATLAFDGIRMTALHRRMTEDYSSEQNREIARYLLWSARDYRDGIERGSPRRGLTWTGSSMLPAQFLKFPAHGHNSVWTADQLSAHGTFVGIRVYRIEIHTSADGREVTSYSEQVVFEYREGDDAAGDASSVPSGSASPSLSVAGPAGGVARVR